MEVGPEALPGPCLVVFFCYISLASMLRNFTHDLVSLIFYDQENHVPYRMHKLISKKNASLRNKKARCVFQIRTQKPQA